MLQYAWRPFHWCYNYYCRTDIDEATVISAQVKIQFRLFKNKILGISCCSTREDPSNDIIFTTVELILTKLGWFQHKSKFNFDFFKKKIKFLCFHAVSTREDPSIDLSITNEGLILTKDDFYLGVRTDRYDFGIFIRKHVKTHTHTHKKKNQLKAQN